MASQESGVETASSQASVNVPGGKAEFTTVNLHDDKTDNNANEPDQVPFVFTLDESVSNQVAPSDSFYTTQADGAAKIRMGTEGFGAIEAMSIPSLFKRTVTKIPQYTAMSVKRDGAWQRYTYMRYYEDVVKSAKSFIQLGLEPHHSVGILGFNSPEWFITFMGSIYAGGIATGIYTTNSPDACHHVLLDSRAQICIVENDMQLQKIIKIREQLPLLKAIVQYEGRISGSFQDVYTWDEFLKLGSSVADSTLQRRLGGQAVNHCCSLIYTSGTTGAPKGVMISHDNYTWLGRALASSINLEFGREVIVSYLPLSHSAAQSYDLISGLATGMSVFFAQPDALKGTLMATVKEIRPTIFGGVPRVWEKIREGLMAAGKSTTGVKRKIGTWAKGVGLQGSYAKINKTAMPKFWGMANSLLFRKVKVALGFDRCKIFVTGAAPTSKLVMEYFMSLDITIHEQFGMSETSGVLTVNVPGAVVMTSIGKAVPGAILRINSPDAEGNGEIQMFARSVMLGYLGQEEKTAETISQDGWISSGDLGKQDKNGFSFITGRIKELLITAGGENIPPVLIEDMVKESLPFINNCQLIGDKHKFLSLLITMKVDVNPDTMEPYDRLTETAKEWCAKNGSDSTTVSSILNTRDEVVLRAIQTGINAVNAKATSNAQKIQKWSILPKDFSLPGGELGPTLKLKRPIVLDRYKKTVHAFYGDES